jgi:disulfide bond formation protein DsbB
LIGLVSGVGASVAGRHVWMQSRPNDEIVFCLPPLDYLLKSSPLDETLRLILSTPGDCKTIDWAMLGLSIPAWSLLGFIVLGAMGLFCNWSRD